MTKASMVSLGLESGQQDGRRRRIHRAIAATPPPFNCSKFVLKSAARVRSIISYFITFQFRNFDDDVEKVNQFVAD